MRQKIYDPAKQGPRLTIACFVSGSGTNYQKIVERDRGHDYVVFSNRPGCGGVLKARANGHPVIELSQAPFLRPARERYGPVIPRNCPEREAFEREAWRLIEASAGKRPDLVCLAGYDQWLTDMSVDRYFPRILNVHPGDSTKGYIGLHWVPAARALLAGEAALRSTLFLVDKGEDTGPVLAQSGPLPIVAALGKAGARELTAFGEITGFAGERGITTYEEFERQADAALKDKMKMVCERLQEALKEAGDWQVYPFAVHDLIARGRVEMDGRAVFVDGKRLPTYGYRLDSTY